MQSEQRSSVARDDLGEARVEWMGRGAAARIDHEQVRSVDLRGEVVQRVDDRDVTVLAEHLCHDRTRFDERVPRVGVIRAAREDEYTTHPLTLRRIRGERSSLVKLCTTRLRATIVA